MIPAGKILGLTVGIVEDREDPDKLGRVIVTLPAFGNRKTDWSQVVVPFAGKTDTGAHGQFWIPEEKDEVLVAFYAGDSKVAYVLGALYSKNHTPPTQNIDERVIQTRKGNIFLMSDEDNKERIEIRTKKQEIVLDEKSTTITLKNKHQIIIDADGKKVQILTESGQKLTLDDNSSTTTIEAPTVVVKASKIQMSKA